MSLSAKKTVAWIAFSVTALLIIPISQPGADASGRDFSRCVSSRNAAKQSCKERCVSDCRSLFPGDEQQQSACASTCKSACVEAEQECKAVCHAIKDGTSPNTP